jgi:hypothetical protein
VLTAITGRLEFRGIDDGCARLSQAYVERFAADLTIPSGDWG